MPIWKAEVERLFEVLPLDDAMPDLRPAVQNLPARGLVSSISSNVPAEVLAGLFLYVDDLEASHEISQNSPGFIGSYWHAIMHRREGDFWNAKYWYRNALRHQALPELDYDPYAFTDACEQDKGQNSPTLVELQRQEWMTLFAECRRTVGDA